jgi:TolB protein
VKNIMIWLGIAWGGLYLSAATALEIVITEGNEAALPIAVAPFPGSTIVSNDLRLSGEFHPLSEAEMISTPTHKGEVNYTDWRLLQIPTLVVGRVTRSSAGKKLLEIQLLDVYQQTLLAHYRFPVGDGNAKKMRKIAHAVSDLVYQKLTGVRGVFSTHIAYISMKRQQGKSTYTLEVADVDGEGAQRLLTSSAPLLSPSWAPDGKRLAYVSFENGRSEVWVQEVYSGKRSRVAYFKGKNSAPAWSPDGKSLALSLSRDGNSEIYQLNLKSRVLRRLTQNRAADTEPVWSQDGSKIAFLSDRSRRPQIYQMAASGGRAERVTFKGRYNTSPDWSPDGSQLAFLNGESGNYRIAVMELDSGRMRILSDNRQDESPSFAPNGRLIVYATQQSGQGVLEVVSVDGGGVQRLSLSGRDVREPVWSPYTN